MVYGSEIFLLPIYSKAREKYDERLKKEFVKKVKVYEDSWKIHSMPLPEEERIRLQERHCTASWRFNDIIGFIQVGYDFGNYITGHIFLKLKMMPKNHYKSRLIPSRYATTLERNKIFHYTEISKIFIENLRDNASIIRSIKDITKDGQRILQEMNKNWNIYEFLPSLKYVNFVEMFQQLKNESHE